MNNGIPQVLETPNGLMRGYFASNPSEDSALIYALAVGAAIWLGSYLWKRCNKPNRKLPPLDLKNKQHEDKD